MDQILAKNDELLSKFLEFFSQNIDQKIIEAKKKSAIPSQIAQIAISPIGGITNEIMENVWFLFMFFKYFGEIVESL